MLEQIKAKLKLHLMSSSENSVDFNIDVDEIPENWSSFNGTKDTWIKIPMPISENSSACLYKAVKGSLFKTHKHSKSKEHMTIMNVGGSFTLITEKSIKKYKYPDSCVINVNELHAVKFDTDCVIMIVWHPMFKSGWEASFVEELND